MTPLLVLCAVLLGVIELALARRLARKYGVTILTGDESAMILFYSRASLEDIGRMQGHFLTWIMMWNLAGILAWLPRL